MSYSDIWRCCVLWLYGGFFLDDDNFIRTKLSEITKQNDSSIVSIEKNVFHDCYQKYYHLSSENIIKTYNLHASNLSAFNTLYRGRVINNWGIFLSQKHY